MVATISTGGLEVQLSSHAVGPDVPVSSILSSMSETNVEMSVDFVIKWLTKGCFSSAW